MAELMYRLGHNTPAMAMRYQHSRLERDHDLGRRLSARAAQRSDRRDADATSGGS